MELIPIHNLEDNLRLLAQLIKLLLESLSILAVVLGVIINGRRALLLLYHPRTPVYIRVRSSFGRALALALEFQLGADIVGTAVAPSFEALGKLAAITVIRTFLNYFLAKELEELKEEEKENHINHYS